MITFGENFSYLEKIGNSYNFSASFVYIYNEMCIWLRHDMLSYEEFTFFTLVGDPTLRVFGMIVDIGF